MKVCVNLQQAIDVKESPDKGYRYSNIFKIYFPLRNVSK